MWTPEIHDELVRAAFAKLTEREINLIQKGSRRVDTYFTTSFDIPITLIVSEAPKHAMTPEGMTKEEAEKKAQEWIISKLMEAARLQKSFEKQGGKSLAETALFSFGEACHTIMDMSSPSHAGFQEYRIPKKTVCVTIILPFVGAHCIPVAVPDIVKYIEEMKEHKKAESEMPPMDEIKQTIFLMRFMFWTTFGDEYYKRIKQT